MPSSLIDNRSIALPGGHGSLETKAVEARQPASPASDDPRLRAYTRLKLALAAQVRLLHEVLKTRGDNRGGKRCDALMVKLAEDRFTLAVLGQFKRGKSSLMNAIIGRELLPVGVLPLTSAITVLRFAPKERLLIEHAHWTFLREVPVERLAEFVTENGNPGNRQQVQAAYLELPLPFLRRGLEFVDTPGVGSAIEANTATTLRFLPACDAAIFTTSADAPLTQAELEFLREIRQHARKLFFVVNKIDLLAPAERTAMIEFAARTIRRETGAPELRVFPVSARAGLVAKQAADPAAYARSGLPELENALAAFLTEEKSAVFLASVLEKTTGLAQRASAELELRARVQKFAEPELQSRRLQLEERLQRNGAERETILGRMRERVVRSGVGEFTKAFDGRLAVLRSGLPRQLTRLLAPCGWQLAGRSARRVADAVVRLQERAIKAWATDRLMRLMAESSPEFSDGGSELAVNLANITGAAVDVVGARPSAEWSRGAPAALQPGGDARASRLRQESDPTERELMPAWHPNAFPAPPSLTVGHAQPKRALAGLPTRFVHGDVADMVLREACHRLWEYRPHLMKFAERVLGEAFDGWAAEVNATAAESGSRALAALSGDALSPDETRAAAALTKVHENLGRLQDEVARFGRDDLSGSRDEPYVEDEGTRPVELPVAEAKIDPARDLRTRGCAVCDYMAKAAFAFFSNWQYALYTDETAQHAFAAEHGLCPLHLWQLEAVSSPTGVSVGQAKLVEDAAQSLRRAARAPRAVRVLPKLAAPGGECRVCRLQRDSGAIYIDRLADFVRAPAGRDAFARSPALCLTHLAHLVNVVADDELAVFLLDRAAGRFEELAENMQSYGMKTEALRRQLRHADEEDAYLRALTLLAGSRTVCAPWNSEAAI